MYPIIKLMSLFTNSNVAYIYIYIYKMFGFSHGRSHVVITKINHTYR